MHMNGTIWTTLTTFVKYLERTNQVTTDKDAFGRWMIKYIDNSEA